MMNFLKTFAAATVAALISAPAFAACTSPTDIDPNSMVFQMYPNADGETYIGVASNAPDLTSLGTVYYSLDELDMVACDGTDWVALGGSGGTGGASSGQRVMVDAGTIPMSLEYYQFSINDRFIPNFDPDRGYKVSWSVSSTSPSIQCDVMFYDDTNNPTLWDRSELGRNICSGTGDSRTCRNEPGDPAVMEFTIDPLGNGQYQLSSNNLSMTGTIGFSGGFQIGVYRSNSNPSTHVYPHGERVGTVPFGAPYCGNTEITYEAYEYQ